MDQEKIGRFICQCRKEKGLTQAQVAAAFGITEQAVSKWENGKNCPDAALMLGLSELFGISVNELLAGERAETPQPACSDACAESRELRRWMMYYFVLCPLLYFLDWLISGRTTPDWLVLLSCVGLSGTLWLTSRLVWVRLSRTGSALRARSFFGWFHALGGAAAIVLALVLMFVFAARYEREQAENRVSVTQENTPAHLLLMLSEDSRPEDVYQAAERYGWYVLEYSVEGGTGYQITVDRAERYRGEQEGAWLYLVFSPESELESALLFIKTGRGTATCTYDPGTEAYAATVKKPLREREAAFDTAQEAVDFVYSAVGPQAAD